MSQRPAVTQEAPGVLRAVWMDTRDSDWRQRIWSSQWTAQAGWSTAQRMTGADNATWPRIAGPHLVFSADRGAALQRDPTWQILYRHAPTPVGTSPFSSPVQRMFVRNEGVSAWRTRWYGLIEHMDPLEACNHVHLLQGSP